MLALAEGWARQSNSPLCSVLAELERIIDKGEFLDPNASAVDNLLTFRVGKVYQDHPGIAKTLAHARRHLENGTPAGEAVARAALKAIWVSTHGVRAYCRSRLILAPPCVRDASLDPRLALENSTAVHLGPCAEGVDDASGSKAAPPSPTLFRGYKEADAPYVERAMALMKADKALSLWAAVQKLEGPLPGRGSDESRRQRVYRSLLQALKTTQNESKE
jgi:hypothetical protein